MKINFCENVEASHASIKILNSLIYFYFPQEICMWYFSDKFYEVHIFLTSQGSITCIKYTAENWLIIALIYL